MCIRDRPNSGTSTPTEGFALDGSTVKLAAAPAVGASYHAVVMGSTVNIGTPSDNTVTTAILQNNSVSSGKIQNDAITTNKITTGAVTEDKIGSLAVVSTKLAPDAVTDTILSDHSSDNSLRAVGTNHIKDEAVTLAKLPHGTSSNDGKFLRANNGADPTFESASSPEIYGFNTNAAGNLIVTTTNGGVDNISGTDYDAFDEVVFAATGFTFSVNANGKLIATI